MRLATYTDRGGTERKVGTVEGDYIVRLELYDPELKNPSMRQVIDACGPDFARLHSLPRGEKQRLNEVRLLAPISDPPGNVICLGRNYADHALETARTRGEEVVRPTFFSKAITAIAGPYDDIPVDSELSTQVDWEVELAVIIGRPAKHVSRENALEYVFGYTVLNDVSARDLQYGYGGQFFYGKSLDGSCPMGPWIVTADDFPHPQERKLRLSVDGVAKQEDSTRNMIFDIRDCIASLSRGMTLLPGQIIATGTPAGVGFARTPPEFLAPGNVVEAEVEGIGTLRNVVVQA